MEPGQLMRFRESLLRWYRKYRRDLPWRESSDPYAVWISEIMLQQTRVSAVTEHYLRFMKRFPTVVALALAEEDEVLALWSGLGYYRRARLLHRAAQVVMSEHGGVIPREVGTLRRMPGVGVYTSAAIASIAHGAPLAAVDGNVERVLARLEGHAEQRGAVKWKKLAQHLLDPAQPGDSNQAMMELGATVCTPKSPKCKVCPVYAWCRTRGEHPVTPRKQMRSVQVAFALVTRGVDEAREVMMEKRPAASSIMPGMWELPQLPVAPENAEAEIIARHSITGTNYYVRVFRIAEEDAAEHIAAAQDDWVALEKLAGLPLTGLARKILRRARLLKLDTETGPRGLEQPLEF
jgi:A/G-specific adenine glycosylase